MAKAKHAPLYYATYRGPDDAAYAGAGIHRRGYPLGQTIQIGQDDANLIRRLVRQKGSTHEFHLERVPASIIGTAEETQPTDPVKAAKLHRKLNALAEAD